MINRRKYRKTNYGHPNDNYRNSQLNSEKKGTFFVSLVSFSCFAYLMTYVYEAGFLNYHGIPSEFVEVNIETMCAFFLNLSYCFVALIVFSLILILLDEKFKDRLFMLLAIAFLPFLLYFLFWLLPNAIGYSIATYKVSGNLVENKDIFPSKSFLIIMFIVALSGNFIRNLVDNLKEMKNIKWSTLFKRSSKETTIKDSIVSLLIITIIIIIFSIFSNHLGKSEAESQPYDITEIDNKKFALIKPFKNGNGVFVEVDNNSMYNVGTYKVLNLSTINSFFIAGSKIKQNPQNK